MVLLNEFSWSFSRANLYTDCQKRYWYTYYGSWEGWPKTPWDKRKEISPLASYLYALKQMQSMPTFIGSTVHETIEHFLKTKKPFTQEALLGHAKEAFYRGLEEAKSGKWKEAPKKHKNLFEIYYGAGLSPDTILEAESKVARCLENWFTSPIVQQLAFHQDSRWLSIEELAFFQLVDKYKIIVVIDFAVMWRDKAVLFDWKTGDESEKTEEQLYLYALFANKIWAIPFDKIILTPFYLAKNSYSKIQSLDPQKLERIEKDIEASCDKLKVLHDSQDVTACSYTEERQKCSRCPFKELCERANYKDLSKTELEELVKKL